MGKVPGMTTLQADGLPADPRETSLPAASPEIQQLFQLALEGSLPRNRELKYWEPDRLNERHLTMLMMRASGIKQRDIARIMGVTDANVSVVMNHPDGVYVLTRLQAARFSMPTEYEKRLEDLNSYAVDAIEELLQDTEVPAIKRVPAAFKLLEMNGHGRKKVEETKTVNVNLNASSAELGLLTRALREVQEIPEINYIDVSPGPGGELPASPPRQLPNGTDAPPIGGSQDPSKEN